jgi:hypothetical protein
MMGKAGRFMTAGGTHLRVAESSPDTARVADAAPYFARAARLGAAEGFYREAPHTSLMFRERGPKLIVTFCNLSSFEHSPEDRLPWLSRLAEARGWSHLGAMAQRKDWYRNPGAPVLFDALSHEAFFDRFQRVIFTGSSMGAFGALVYASFAPRPDVLAFSPQSTLNTDIAPFEARYRWPRRKFDWTAPQWLDAAEYVGRARRVIIAYDPMLAEDKAHAARLLSPSVELLACRFMGHQLPNALKRAGVLEPLLDMAMEGRFDRAAFYRSFRGGRRRMVDWRKALVRHALEAGKRERARTVCWATQADMPGPWFRKTLARIDAEAAKARA